MIGWVDKATSRLAAAASGAVNYLTPAEISERRSLIQAAAEREITTRRLMTGPRATPPRQKTIRKAIREKLFSNSFATVANPVTGYRWAP